MIEDGRATLPSILQDEGYATAMIGKWHLGMQFPGDRNDRDWAKPVTDMPLDKGFGYFYGIPASLNYGVLAWFEGRHAKVPPTLYTAKKPNGVAINDYRIMPPYKSGLKELNLPDDQGNVRGPLEIAPDFVDNECLTRFTDKTLQWLEQRDEEKPFFLYLPYTSPHKPVIPTKRFLGKSQAGAYGDFMMETDWHIGRVLEYLDEHDLAQNTLVIFSSDNGPETTWRARQKKFNHDSNGVYREGKRSIYEGGHRVPLFVRWPAGVAAGSTWEKPICQTDLIATVAELMDIKLAKDAAEDSVSFLPALMGTGGETQRLPLIHHDVAGRFAIRDGDWKLVMETASGKKKRELYYMADDPAETANVLADHPEVAKRLLIELTRIVRSGATDPEKQSENDTGWWNHLVWIERW